MEGIQKQYATIDKVKFVNSIKSFGKIPIEENENKTR